MNKGSLIVVSGPSGCGKGTVCKELVKDGRFCVSISATSRKPRDDEEDGVSYFFKTREEFEKLIEEDMLIEYAEYVGNYYGTPKRFVEEKLSEGVNVILEIEVQGAMKIKEKFPEAKLLFLLPPSISELEARLRGRGTESEEAIVKRLQKARTELGYLGQYEYFVVNNTVEQAVEDIKGELLC